MRTIAAATESFCEIGWVATTMAEVARRAGLTRQTVYQQFSGKLVLLNACIDSALSGATGTPLRELPAYRALGSGDVEQRIAAAARWLSAVHMRSAQIQHVLDQAAVTDPAAAELLVQREQRRWEEFRWALGLILDTAPPDRLVDSAWWAASRRGWLTFVGGRGWDAEQWEQWFIAHLRADLARH